MRGGGAAKVGARKISHSCENQVGMAGRVAALGIIGIMLGAILTHAPNGFFMNWFGGLPAGQEGFEYHLMTIALAAVVVIKGSGWISLDRWLARSVEDRR